MTATENSVNSCNFHFRRVKRLLIAATWLFDLESGTAGQHQWQCYNAAGDGGSTVLSDRTDNSRIFLPTGM